MRALRTYLVLFLATAVPFGLLMALGGVLFAGYLGIGWRSAGAFGLIAGLACGAVMSLTLGTAQVIGSRGTTRGTSTGPRQERTVDVAGGPDLIERVRSALRTIPADIRSVDLAAGRLVARRGASWWSWGEEVVVQLAGDPQRPTVTVTSRPGVRTTLVDYGQGRRNVDHVVAHLTR